MTEPRPTDSPPLHHTHIASERPVARVEFEPESPGYAWYPKHAWLHRAGVYPLLTPGARSMMDVMLWRLWEESQQPGHTPGIICGASIEQLAAWYGVSKRSAFRDVEFLLEPPPEVLLITGSPARLLAKLGPTVWEPLPGRHFARR